MIIDHTHPEYIKAREFTGKAKYNGCYYYSCEIVKNIIPNVDTKRDWNTVGRDLEGMHEGMIVFLHDNATPWHYNWLRDYTVEFGGKKEDCILVCSSKYVADSVQYWGKTIVLPMSVDTEYVKQFAVPEKTRDTCIVGNPWVVDNARTELPAGIDVLSAMPREDLLRELAKYRHCYAIDRCAIEAKVLGVELLPLETRYSVDNVGNVLDNREAAKILQEKLNEIDGGNNED